MKAWELQAIIYEAEMQALCDMILHCVFPVAGETYTAGADLENGLELWRFVATEDMITEAEKLTLEYVMGEKEK
jgi:hypothetical protein